VAAAELARPQEAREDRELVAATLAARALAAATPAARARGEQKLAAATLAARALAKQKLAAATLAARALAKQKLAGATRVISTAGLSMRAAIHLPARPPRTSALPVRRKNSVQDEPTPAFIGIHRVIAQDRPQGGLGSATVGPRCAWILCANARGQTGDTRIACHMPSLKISENIAAHKA
jgi:hypothetical protein